MNLIAMILLSLTLGFFVQRRRTIYFALVAVWAVILAPQTHSVLLVDQLDDRSYGNTIGYFVINYAFLAGGIGIATIIHSRRHRHVPGATDQASIVDGGARSRHSLSNPDTAHEPLS